MTGSEDEPPGTGRREPDEVGGHPVTSRRDGRDFSGLSADLRVDILSHGDRVIVVTELPGVEEETIAIRLLNPYTLRITAKRAYLIGERDPTRERGNGTVSRLIRLPASVTAENAEMDYRNGVLEVRLKKIDGGSGSGGKEISIE